MRTAVLIPNANPSAVLIWHRYTNVRVCVHCRLPETRKKTAAKRMKAVRKLLNALVRPYNNVRRLASDTMQERHARLACAPKNIADFTAFDTVKRADAARFGVLRRYHKVLRRREEIEIGTLST